MLPKERRDMHDYVGKVSLALMHATKLKPNMKTSIPSQTKSKTLPI
jgi:hypothetical protein